VVFITHGGLNKFCVKTGWSLQLFAGLWPKDVTDVSWNSQWNTEEN